MEEDFAAWYEATYRRVYASILLLTADRSVASEAVDEAFTRALERWARVRNMASPAGWTWVVARNLVRRAHRLERQERETIAALASEVGLPDQTIEIWDLICRLSPRAQELVALRYLAGLSEHEIAATLRIAPGTVARGLHDARHRLELHMHDDEERVRDD